MLKPYQQQHLDRLVQEGCSGTLYFDKLEGGPSEQPQSERQLTAADTPAMSADLQQNIRTLLHLAGVRTIHAMTLITCIFWGSLTCSVLNAGSKW